MKINRFNVSSVVSMSHAKGQTIAILLIIIFQPLSRAEEARFFRVKGPVASTIMAVTAHGEVTWTNVATNATFTIQTVQSLSQTNWADYIQVLSSNAMTTHWVFDPNPPSGMVLIPAGSFTMGNSFSAGEGDSDELPLHSVYVSAFYMDKYEVTKALWDEVYNWAITHGYSFEYGARGKGATHPAWMTWYDSVKWCNARSEKEGRTPAYYTNAAQTTVYRSGQVNVQNDWVKWDGGYRLPTEAEWEKAARGGSSGHRFPWSDTDNITHSQANYYSSSNFVYDTSPTLGYHPSSSGEIPYTIPVGFFAANGYGLYDMAGNVSEWCWDWYGSYSSALQIDPHGPASGPYRVIRDGCWFNDPIACRSASRQPGNQGDGFFGLGFRSVLPSGQP